MSRTAIFNAHLVDPSTNTDTKGGLVFSNAGVIVDMGAHLAKAPSDITNVIDAGGRILAPGIVDLRVKTGEPGNENKETLATASKRSSSWRRHILRSHARHVARDRHCRIGGLHQSTRPRHRESLTRLRCRRTYRKS